MMPDLGFSFTSENGCIRANLLRHDMQHLREGHGRFLLSTAIISFDEAKKLHKTLGDLIKAGPVFDSQPDIEDDFSDVL